jgi:hypothetical protein
MYTMDPGTQDGVSIWHRRRSLVPKDRSMRRRRTWTHSSTEGRSKGAHAVEFSKTVAPLREGDSFPGRVRECFRSRSGPVSIAPAPPHGERTSNGSPEHAKCPWLRQLYHPYLEGRFGPFRPAPGKLAPAITAGSGGGRSPGKLVPAMTAGSGGGRSQAQPARRIRHESGTPEAGARGYDRTCTVTVRRRGRSSKSIRTTCCQVPSWRWPSTIGIVSEGPMTAALRWAWEFVSWLRRLCS